MKPLLAFLTLSLCAPLCIFSQLRISGQASAAFVKANGDSSQYSVNGGRGTFSWRWDIFADATISEDIAFLSNMRMLQDQVPHIDLFALRFSNIASTGLNIQAGQIDLPFGNLGEQRFPKQNPFLNLPLINEHITALCESDYNLWTFSPWYQIKGNGVRILDQGLYDLGVKAYGSVGIIDYAAALINGMVNATGTYSPFGLNPNRGFGKLGRLAITPVTGLTVGASYGLGPFMKDVSGDTLSQLRGKSPDNYLQEIVGGDVSFSFDHFSLHAEVIYNTWQYVQDVTLKATGYSAAIRYAFTPRLSCALRGGGILFNRIKIREYIPEAEHGYTGPTGFVPYNGKWDHDVLRLEGAVGYKLDEALLVKAGYQVNRTFDLPRDPVDNMLFAQTVVNF